MAKILLADDEAHVRHVMRYKLQRAGHAVLTAVNGQDALERARHALPDLVISDQQMPLLSGLELCRSLYAGAATRHVPVILVTSREFEIGPAQTRGTNVRRVMSKPFSPSALVGAVSEVLAARVAGAA
jgi:CheY-like chemotaxis protein